VTLAAASAMAEADDAQCANAQISPDVMNR
jgi:hypothetical protein